MGKPIRPHRLPTHVFSDSGARTVRGERICDCGSAEGDSRHRIHVPDEVFAEEARRVGETRDLKAAP